MTHYLERIISSNKDLPHIVVKLPIQLETEEKIEEKIIVFNVPTHIIEVATHYPVKYLLHLMHCVTMCKGELVWDEDSSPCDDAQLRQRWHAPDQLSWPKVRFIAAGTFILLDPSGCDDRITASTFPSSKKLYKKAVEERDGLRCIISGRKPGKHLGSVLDKAHIVPSNKKSLYIERLTTWATQSHPNSSDPMYAVITGIHDPRNILTLYKTIHTLCQSLNWGFTLLRVPNDYLEIQDLKWNPATHEGDKPYPSGELLYLFHPLHKDLDPQTHDTFAELLILPNGVVKPSADLTVWPTHALFDYWFGCVAMLYWIDTDTLGDLIEQYHDHWCPPEDQDSSGSFENESDASTVHEHTSRSSARGTKVRGGRNSDGLESQFDIGNILMWFYGTAAEQKERAASVARAANWVHSQQETTD